MGSLALYVIILTLTFIVSAIFCRETNYHELCIYRLIIVGVRIKINGFFPFWSSWLWKTFSERYLLYLHTVILLSHLRQRLGELIVYPCSDICTIVICPQFQTSSSPKNIANQSQLFMEGAMGSFGSIWVTWPRGPPGAYMVNIPSKINPWTSWLISVKLGM